MRRLIMVASLLGAVVGVAVTGGPTFADGPNGTVVATVQVSVGPCINIAPTSFTYAPEGFSTDAVTRTTIPAAGSVKPVVENCSDRSESILARGGPATGTGANWTLVPSFSCGAGTTDQYIHKLKQESSSGNFAFSLSDINQLWEASVPFAAGSDTRTIDSQLTMPCTGSSGLSGTKSVPIYLTAVIP